MLIQPLCSFNSNSIRGNNENSFEYLLPLLFPGPEQNEKTNKRKDTRSVESLLYATLGGQSHPQFVPGGLLAANYSVKVAEHKTDTLGAEWVTKE